MMNNETALIVTAMKNEGPYIVEWVAHHMAIGFDRFFVATNDCDDGTDRILDRLSSLIDLQHVPNPKQLMPDRGNWQIMAMRYAGYFNTYKDAGWIYFTDVDEFLFIHAEAGTLDALYEASGGFDVISFTSTPFGSNGVKDIVDAPVTAQFTRQTHDYAAMEAASDPTQNAIKTMFHNRIEFDLRRNHRPRRKDFSTTAYRWIDGSGNTMSPDWTDGRDKAISPLKTRALAQFNHYAIRSAEAFLNKADRGDVAGVPRLDADRRLGYWNSYDRAGAVNTDFAAPLPRAREIRDRLMSDSKIADLHAAAVAAHQARAREIRANPAFENLIGPLGLTPLDD